jgi:DNA primase large subunit
MTLRNKKGAELKMEMDNILDKYLPMKSNFSNSPDLYQERRKDHISHFVLRMAYSRR